MGKWTTWLKLMVFAALGCLACKVIAVFAQDGLDNKRGYVKPQVLVLYGGDNDRVRDTHALATKIILTEINKFWANEVNGFGQIQQYLTPAGQASLENFFRNKRAWVAAETVEVYLVNGLSSLEVWGIPLLVEPAGASHEALQTEFVLLGFKDTNGPHLEYIKDDASSFHSYAFRSARTLTPKESQLLAPVHKFIRDLENAYNNRDIAYLRQVYPDTAQIVVGKELNPNDLLIKRNTKTYLDSLESKFKRVKKLSVRYDKTGKLEDIRYNAQLKIEFAIEIYQIWEDDEYKDRGWVRLYLEFDDKKRGVIGIRDWLPEKQWKEPTQ